MVKFKCIATGTVIQFEHPVDIETTRANPAYEELKDGLQTKEKQDTEEKVTKKKKVTE